MSKESTQRQTLIKDRCQTLLNDMLREEDNKYCVDCDAKGPRWGSWNLGLFLCIRCAGIHRNLGVHISKVKSVNLDTWTPEQVLHMTRMGNSLARSIYESTLESNFRRPQTDSTLETFIRQKYEHKKWTDKTLLEEISRSNPIDLNSFNKCIDEEVDKMKNKKKIVGSAMQPLFSGFPGVKKVEKEKVEKVEEVVQQQQTTTESDLFDVFSNPTTATNQHQSNNVDLLQGLSSSSSMQNQQQNQMSNQSILSLYNNQQQMQQQSSFMSQQNSNPFLFK